MQEENKTFLVVGSFQSGKSELVRYFGEDAREFNFYPTTNYEYKYSLTTHPKQHTYLFHDEIITFIDTPGHSDFLHETLTLLKVIKNVILVLNFEENIEILHFDLLDDLKDKNVYLIFNKTDVSFKNGLKSEEIKEIIKNIRLYIKIKDIFIASAKDAWIYKYDYLYCKSSEVGFIYNLKRIKKRYAMDKFRASNSFLYQVKRFLVPEKEDTLFLYVFKKYFFREQMVTLIYSNFVIKVGEEYNGYKVKKIIIDFSELKDTLENVPSFVIFDKEVRNDTFLVGREDYQSKSVPLIYKVNLLDNNLFLEVKKFKDIFLNLNFGESVISAPSELIFDAFFNDFCQFKYKKILLREAGIKEKRIYNKKEKKGGFNFLEKNNFSFLIEKSVSFLNPLLTKVNNHSFYNSTILIDPFVLSEVIKVFEFIFSELEVYENDELISLNVTLIHAITNKKYQESIYEDAKEALIEELNSDTEKKSIFLSVKIFYEELVHDILVDNFTFLNYYKLLSSKYCVVKTMIKNEELIGFDNKVFDLTLGKAVCIKKFHGFE